MKSLFKFKKKKKFWSFLKREKKFKIRYPRLLAFVLTIIVAIVLFYEWLNSEVFHNFLTSLWYLGTFLWWLLYSYGFTSTSATAVLLIIAKEKILLLSILIAGVWALISDLVIFFFAKTSLLKEINALKKEAFVVKIRNFLKKTFGSWYRHIMPIVAWILIMSPLPTEIWVTMLASRNKMSTKKFLLIAYILHTIGIAIILTIWQRI